MNAAGTTATLNPTADLKAGTSYTARVTGAKDLAGNTVTARSWTFTTAAASSTTVTLTTTADTYVNSASPSTSYGTATTAWVDNSPVDIGYLKFNLAPYAGRTITGALLELRTSTNADSGSGGTFTVRPVSDDSWSESTTYTTRKTLGNTTLGSLVKPTTNTAYSVPLTASALQGDIGSTLSLGLTTTSADGMNITTRQSTTAPTLKLTLAATTTTSAVTLTPTADTYVNSASPGSQYGTSATVWVDNSPINTGYLKFNLAPYAGRTITAATLRLHTTTSTSSGSGGTFTVRPVSDDSWSESTTYTTRKAVGSTILGSLAKPTATDAAYSVTLTPSGIQADIGSTLSLGLTTTSSDGLAFTPRQTSTPPTLQLTLR